MIADAGHSPWATGLVQSLQPLPVDLHWSRSDVEAIDLLAATGMHLAVVDRNLPESGGLDLLRRVRNLGLEFPTLLVCDDADPRLLQTALELNVYSVVSGAAEPDLLTPMVLKVFRQFYRFDWSPDYRTN